MKYLENVKEHRWIILILILATVLRFYNLGFQSAWLDEVHTLKESDPDLPYSQFYPLIIFHEGIPHLYFLIVRFISEVFGSNIYVARIPSAISGVLTVWFVYLLGKTLCNKRAGQISALLLTLNYIHIEYSQEARSYALLAFFATASFYYLVRFVQVANLKYALLLGLFCGLITNMQPIGLVNVAAIYFIVFIVLILNGTQHTKKLLSLSLVSLLMAFIVLIPVYPSFKKVSVMNNLWIQPLSWESMSQVLVSLSGNSKIVLAAVALSIIYFFINVVRMRSNQGHRNFSQNGLLFGFLILFVWLFSEIAGIVLKSYFGDSIILSRYFIAILPAMMLFLGIGIELIKSNIIKIAVSGALSACLVFAWFSPVNYYTTVTKSQYDKVSEIVIQKNTKKDKVVSNWGWLLTYYFVRDYQGQAVIEMTLEKYIAFLKDNPTRVDSFWYIDGNSRGYAPSPEDKKFIKDHFTTGEKIIMQDAWAYHFILKQDKGSVTNKAVSEIKLNLENFENATFDASGALIFGNNKVSSYPRLSLEKGKYKLLVKGISLPEQPINNENAHFKLLIGGRNVGQFTLSEKKNADASIVYFTIADSQEGSLALNYDNDIVVGTEDRKAKIKSITIIKE